MIRLLLDMGLPRRTAADLAEEGWDVEHAGTVGLAEASDQEIMRHAEATDRVVVTLDSDFSRLLARSRASAPSVVFIRIERLGRAQATSLIRELVPTIQSELERGCIAAVTRHDVRIRRLPVP